MNVSINPYSGRNPSYCFVELVSKAHADGAMQNLNGQNILGRPVKLGPGVAASAKRKVTNQNKRGGYPETPQGGTSAVESRTEVDRKAWNGRYLFVDFPNADEAKRAAKATDGRYAWGVKLRVQIARDADSHKARERGEWYDETFDAQPS
ncbi:MAG: hypothetical protein Q9166_005884 [cf. Caloplaca sp. 2 TL-2023]